MKRVVVIFLSCLLIYSYFKKLTVSNTLIIVCSAVLALLLSRMRIRILEKARYPVIAISLLTSTVGILYPTIYKVRMMDVVCQFFSIASVLIFLAFSHTREKSFLKECLPFCVVYSSSCINLFLCGQLPLIIPISVAATVYLYIIMRTKQMISLFTMGLALGILMWVKGIRVFDVPSPLAGYQRLILFGASFFLFMISFLYFVRDRRQDPNVTFIFLGMMTIIFDIILSFGLSFNYGLSRQPYLAALIVVVLSGIMMKKEMGTA